MAGQVACSPAFAVRSTGRREINFIETFAAQGWSLEVACWSCKRVVYLAGDELVRRFGPPGSTGAIFSRLRCDCGQGLPALRAVER